MGALGSHSREPDAASANLTLEPTLCHILCSRFVAEVLKKMKADLSPIPSYYLFITLSGEKRAIYSGWGTSNEKPGPTKMMKISESDGGKIGAPFQKSW